MNPEILVRIDSRIGRQELSDLFAGLRAEGFVVDTKLVDRSGPFGALDWLLPTAIGVYLMKPYVDGFLTKAGEDHYESIKNIFVGKVWPLFFGPKRRWKSQIETPSGIKKTAFSTAFSISHTLSTKTVTFDVRLLLKKDSSKKEMAEAIYKYLSLLNAHRAGNTLEDFAMRLYELDSGRRWTKLVWLNPSSGEIEYLDAVESSKQRKVISHPFV